MPRIKQSLRPDGLKKEETTEKKVTRKSHPEQRALSSRVVSGSKKEMPKQVRHDKQETPKAALKKTGGLSVPVLSLTGKEVSTMTLPKEVFGVEINKPLLSQATRIYLNNQKSHWGNTKTRGEVMGSTRKIWKQKGTGRARHGSIMAPIFVGGGIALGPKYRKVEMELPKRMKRAALISALSQKVSDNQIVGVSGLEKVTGKTREMALFIKSFGKKTVLIVSEEKLENALRGVSNLKSANLVVADNLSILDIFKHQTLVLTSGAVEKLQAKVLAKGKQE